jgi:hypothetical protein
MAAWQIELLKIGAASVISFIGGLGSFWLYLHKRKIEKIPEQEKLQEVEKLTTLLIQHRKHKISTVELNEFKEVLLSSSSRNKTGHRRLEEILEAEEEFLDKIWYTRHKMLEDKVNSGTIKVDHKIWQGALKSAKNVEEKYGIKQLGPWDDFDWGMINGKLSALRWVLGEEWDVLDA